MKAVDRVGNALGIGSIVLCGNAFRQDDPIYDYRIVASTNGQTGIRLLCPTVQHASEAEKAKPGFKPVLTCTSVKVEGALLKDSTGLVLQFKNLLVATNVPESISNRLYQAVLHRAAKTRGK